MISVLVADDHVVVRDGLVAVLQREADLRVVAEVSDGETAFAEIDAIRPDVALVDVTMPRMTGIEVARQVRDAGLGTAVVLLSMHTEPVFVRAALEVGVVGYVLKSSGAREMLDAIRAAARGDTFLSSRVTAPALSVSDREREERRAKLDLTCRERDVLRLLARGLSSKEIAVELGLSTKTVGWYREEIMRKLEIRNVPGLVKYALKSHLATLEE